MRIAVFGDISSDYNGLINFFQSSKNKSIDKYVCLGDISHHKSPRGRKETDNCVKILQSYRVISIRGNHDERLAQLSPRYVKGATIDYLHNLPKKTEIGETVFLHNPFSERFLSWIRKDEVDYLKNLYPNHRIFFGGHTHKRVHLQKNAKEYKLNFFPKFNEIYDVSSGIHLINPGTIDGAKFPWGFNEKPSYLIYDTRLNNIQFFKISSTPS